MSAGGAVNAMEKAREKTRDIKFYSEKNHAMICVHTAEARDYAKYLETQDGIESYETNYPLELERFSRVSPVGIRSEYLKMEWTSDFFLRDTAGRRSIHEIATPGMLEKRSVIERLELSRRYWSALDIQEWRIILCGARGR